MDLSKLAIPELVDFLLFRGITVTPEIANNKALLIRAATPLLIPGSPVTYPLADLAIASQLAIRDSPPKYSLHDLETSALDQIQVVGQVLGLSPTDIALRDRVIRILRFKDLINPDVSCGFISNISPSPINISQIVCGRLKRRTDWTDLLSGRVKESCTPLGFKIATSLIRIASTRIFADPEQSILELPVNSIDSYADLSGSTKPKIGKFGLGFFSFLYWLIGHPARQIIIMSTFTDYDGNLCSYKLTMGKKRAI